jgi:hypothetical protein
MQSLLDPAILFFLFGIFAGAVKSDLEIPPAIAKFLSLYLLMALGLKGGFELASAGFNHSVLVSVFAALLLAFLVPLLGYQVLKRWVSGFDAAAIAASYGSVSAVTFITAVQYLETQQMNPGGYMTIALVLMESPAIIVAILLANHLRHKQAHISGNLAVTNKPALKNILHESFTNGAHMLLLGALVVGYFSGESGKSVMAPFSIDLFKGMLAFFLLDMGLLVAKNFNSVRGKSWRLIAYGIIAPWIHAALALAVAMLFNLPAGDAALLMVLTASASYIVVPAVLRYAIPEANASLYFGLSLGITFPMNIIIGIPAFSAAARYFIG